MPSSEPVAELLAELEHLFARLGVRWFLFDGQAAILHGVARLSADIDVTVDLADRSARGLVDVFSDAGLGLRVADVDHFVDQTRVLPFVDRSSRIPVDVVLAGPGLEEQFFAGAEQREVAGVAIPVAGAADLVAMKVLAGRPCDLEDVEAIVRAQGRGLDLGRARSTLLALERALDRRDLVNELDRILGAAER